MGAGGLRERTLGFVCALGSLAGTLSNDRIPLVGPARCELRLTPVTMFLPSAPDSIEVIRSSVGNGRSIAPASFIRAGSCFFRESVREL